MKRLIRTITIIMILVFSTNTIGGKPHSTTRSEQLARLLVENGYSDKELMSEAKALWSSLAAEGNRDAKYHLAGLPIDDL